MQHMRISAETNFSIYDDIPGSEQSFITGLQIQTGSISNITKLGASPFQDVTAYY